MHDINNDDQPSSVSGGAPSSHQAKRVPPQSREDQIARSKRPILVAPSRIRGVLERLATLSLLGIFSFLGLLIRLGLSTLMAYGGQPVFPLLWAQIVGCAVMGVVSTRRSHLEQIWLPLYAGLATGLPGSITTFSSWMRDVFQAFAHIESVPHERFYDFLDGLTQTVMTLAASMGAFVFGVHLASLLLPERMLVYLQKRSKAAGLPTPPPEKGHPPSPPASDRSPPHALLDGLSVLVFILLWLAACLVSYYVEGWRGIVMFSLVLAPLGTWVRFYLSQLNPRIARFPLGTFLANLLGTALLALCVALQTTGTRTRLQCQILQGFDDGLCGCLTTVSTLVAEIRKLNRRDAYVYAVASWAAGQAVMLLILGSTSFAREDGLQPRCAL